MSIAASAENTMFKKETNTEIEKKEKEKNEIEKNEIKKNEIEKNEIEKNEIEKNEIEKNEIEKKEITENENENEEIHDSDDDMIVITIRETCKNQGQEKQEEVQEEEVKQEEQEEPAKEVQEAQAKEEAQEEPEEAKSKKQEEEEAQKEEELFFELKDDMEKKKLFPIMPCNMVSAFGCAMEHVEYLDIKDVERKALAIELVKCLAYINNEYGARECFDYLFQNNMTDDIIKTIIDCTKNRYDINKYPHTNRNIMLSCVSLSNKVKNKTKPKMDLLEDLFEFNFKFNFCDLKRFFRIKDDSKNV
jgi:hypothetical protein